jgi:phage-related protein
MAVPFSDLQQVAPSAVIELFQLELNAAQHGANETYYFHAGVNTNSNNDIVWNSQSYMAFPIEATDFEYTGTGSLPRPKLRVSNIFGTITALILSLPNGLEGAKVTRIRTLARYLDSVNFPPSELLLLEDGDTLLLEDGGGIGLEADNPTADPTAEFPREIYYIDRKAGENRDAIEFELAAAFDLVGVRAPKRQCVSNVCQWKYRGPECGYVGNAYFDFNDAAVGLAAQDVCGKRLRSCELRFSQQRFGGNVTAGSNVITLDAVVSLSTSDPVSGFGLPAGTTVSSVSGNLITVSQNATATTFVTSAGTIQSNYTQIVLSSAAGIAPGMAVFGNYLPANTQVVAVSGNTITLSSTVDLTQFYTAIGSFTGTPSTYFYFSVTGSVITSDLSAPGSVGQIIASPGVLDLSRNTTIIEKLTRYLSFGKTVGQTRVFGLSQIPVQTNTAATFSVYQFNGIPSATYSFGPVDRNYTFRASALIPYGSYPGVGTYSA